MIGILDLETGGFSISKNGICEIAIAAVTPELEITDVFQCYIKPYKRDDSDELVSYKDDAMAVNGIKVEDLIHSGLDVEIAISKAFEFIEQHNIKTIIAHGKKFDIPRVNYLGNRFISKNLDHLQIECSIELAKQKIDLASYSLENLCLHFGIDNSQKHTALGDSLSTLEVLKKLKAI